MKQYDLFKIASKMKFLEESGDLQIRFDSLDSIYGFVYKSNNDKFLIVINTNISYEKQISTLWHEAAHVCFHMNKPEDFKIFDAEIEADCLSDSAHLFHTMVCQKCNLL